MHTHTPHTHTQTHTHAHTHAHTHTHTHTKLIKHFNINNSELQTVTTNSALTVSGLLALISAA